MPKWWDRLLGRDLKDPEQQKELEELRRKGKVCKNNISRAAQQVKKATRQGEFKVDLPPDLEVHEPGDEPGDNGAPIECLEETITVEEPEEEKAA